MDNLSGLLSAMAEIGIVPKDRELYRIAVTHSSYLNEHPQVAGDNERLEFLGDAILDFIVSEQLYERYSASPEGLLTRLRARLVCEPSLARVAAALNLGQYLRLGKGEEATGGRAKPSILAGTVEALVAAVFLDLGLEAARLFTQRTVLHDVDRVEREITDYKSALQELVQADKAGAQVTYRTVGETGPDHARIFTVEALVGGVVAGSGSGRSKRAAEQEAARVAIRSMKGNDG